MISDEAVEAAARAIFLLGFPDGCGVSWDPEGPTARGFMRDIRVGLEAAEPYMRTKQ